MVIVPKGRQPRNLAAREATLSPDTPWQMVVQVSEGRHALATGVSPSVEGPSIPQTLGLSPKRLWQSMVATLRTDVMIPRHESKLETAQGFNLEMPCNR